MNAVDIVLILVIVALVALAARRTARNFKGDGDCCGGGAKRPRIKKVRVDDTDEKHYPYETDVKIGGMTCENCVRAVENAINGIGGTWARVSLESGTAHVLSKEPLDNAKVKQAVEDAGYYIPRRS